MIDNNKPYVIGETAFHHEGQVEILLKLIEEAERISLNAIKFHLLLDLEDYIIASHEAKEVLKPWCLKESDWNLILNAVKQCDIILLCNDVKSVHYAVQNQKKVKAIEIHATGLNDIFLLDAAATFNGTVILGTGGSTLDEIDFAIQRLNSRGKQDILLMHGFQSYPTEYKDIKLTRMMKLTELFGLPVGYADHTDPNNEHVELISVLGIASGFNVMEKHFTHLYGEKRIDAQSAVSVDTLQNIKSLASVIWEASGSDSALEMTTAEANYGNTGPMKKAIVARKKIEKGEEISMKNIAYKRTNESSPLRQNEVYKLLGNKAATEIQQDELIHLKNVEFSFKPNSIEQFKNTDK